jgi:hypothetical protein
VKIGLGKVFDRRWQLTGGLTHENKDEDVIGLVR